MVFHPKNKETDNPDEISIDELREGYERFKKVQRILRRVGTYDYVMTILHSAEEKEREIIKNELRNHPPKKDDTKVEESLPVKEVNNPPAKTEENPSIKTGGITPHQLEQNKKDLIKLLTLTKENEDLREKLNTSSTRHKEILKERNVARENLEEIGRDVKSLRDETYAQAKNDLQQQKEVLKKEQTDIEMGVL